MVQGRKKRCETCGIDLHVSNRTGYCMKHLRERARLRKLGKLRSTFITKVTVVEIDGKKVLVG